MKIPASVVESVRLLPASYFCHHYFLAVAPPPPPHPLCLLITTGQVAVQPAQGQVFRLLYRLAWPKLRLKTSALVKILNI